MNNSQPGDRTSSSSASATTGVLVHGCNLNIENWRNVAWGEPPDNLGRIPAGVLVAAENQADVIVFGTGASKKEFKFGDHGPDKNPILTEAEFSLEFLKTHFHLLRRFKPLCDKLPWLLDEVEYPKRRQELINKIVLDSESMNTLEEIRNAGKIFVEHNCERVILVSSPSHIVRCLRDAADVFHGEPQFARFRNNIFASPSITCYEGTDAGDVVVVEPPHRPDRQVVPTHRRIQRMMVLQRLPYEQVSALIEEFDDLLQKYEDIYFSSVHQDSQQDLTQASGE